MIKIYSKVPYELQELERWCNWKVVSRNGKDTKMPVCSRTGDLARSNDDSTWSTFDEAVSASPHYDGIGFFFKEPYVGVDIDDVREDIEKYKNNDHKDNIVSEFVDLLGSYAEISPSGNGIHIILKGSLPPQGRRKGNVEVYDSGRFFTVTSDAIGGYTHISDDEGYGKLNYLHNKYIASDEPTKRREDEESKGNDLPEEELVRIAENSQNGTRFKLLYRGGWEQFYDSQSEADMAFANDLAFWTARDFQKMDNIFRSSSLNRDKWNSKRGESTYGRETLEKAISDCMNVFSPQPANKGEEYQLHLMQDSVKKVENKFYSYDDTGNAERFTDAHGEILRYNYARRNWYFYNGKTWTIDQEGKIKNLADEVIESMKHERLYVGDGVDEEEATKLFNRHLKSTRNHTGKTNMIRESEHLMPVSTDAFDGDLNLFNTQNGYLDLKKGVLKEHSKDKFFTKISNVEYTDKSDCPKWNDFLNQIFDNDQELIDYIQRAVGYSLSGSTEEQVMFVLHGNGRNGKSVFLDVITDIFGSYSTNIQPQAIMVKHQMNGPNPDIAKLAGARLVTTTEPNEGQRFDEGLIKQLTGGDKVTARFLHENEFEFTPQFKLWMATNHKPFIRGTDDGIWRRMAIIPFTVQIPEHKVDRKLPHKLKREINAILHWCLEGYLKWQKHGLQEPSVIREQRAEYRTEMDSIEAFIQECCVLEGHHSVRASDLFQAYDDWARTNNEYKMSGTKFGREISKKFSKFRSNGTYYKGIKVAEGKEKPFFRMDYG